MLQSNSNIKMMRKTMKSYYYSKKKIKNSNKKLIRNGNCKKESGFCNNRRWTATKFE